MVKLDGLWINKDQGVLFYLHGGLPLRRSRERSGYVHFKGVEGTLIAGEGVVSCPLTLYSVLPHRVYTLTVLWFNSSVRRHTVWELDVRANRIPVVE